MQSVQSCCLSPNLDFKELEMGPGEFAGRLWRRAQF
jgi:hypothetical protein